MSAENFLLDLYVLSRLSRMVRSPIVAAISYVVYNYSCRPQVLLMPHLSPSSPARLICSLSSSQSLPCSLISMLVHTTHGARHRNERGTLQVCGMTLWYGVPGVPAAHTSARW